MGSSKKHKEKEKEKKRRHRSRSRSRSREKLKEKPSSERDKHHHKKHRDKERSKKDKRSSPESEASGRKLHPRDEVIDLEEGEIDVPPKTPSSSSERPVPPPPPRITLSSTSSVDSGGEGKGGGGGGSLSLSISETNRLRAKLGLKPLQVDSDIPSAPPPPSISKEDGSQDEVKADPEGKEKKDFVHKPAENISEVKRTQQLKEKLVERREKRRLEAKLAKVKSLAADGNDPKQVDNAAAWVEKSRRLQEEKTKAQQRARALEELDAEFGVGDLIQSEFQKERGMAYGTKDLTGLRVLHGEDKFAEGKEVILTIKDKGVLEDGEDVLVNVNLIDEERYDKRAEVKKMKPYLYGYNVYEENEVDEFGNIKKKGILSKYDEEIDGEKKSSFVIGGGFGDAQSKDRELASIRSKLQKKTLDSLNTLAIQPASDYFTPDEMVQFKKPAKKVRKVRRRKVLKADDLILIAATTSKDRGSRSGNKEDVVEDDSVATKAKKESEDFRKRLEVPMELDDEFDVDDLAYPTEDLSNVQLEPDTLELDLQMALNKSIKLKQQEQQQKASIEKIADEIKTESMDEEDAAGGAGKGFIVLNSTAEFCRTLGDIPTYGLAGNREDEEDDLMDFEKEVVEEKPRVDEEKNRGAWNEVEIDETPVEIKSEEVPILDEEPDVGSGLAGALRLAVSKGYLEKETKKNISATRMKHLQAQHYSIEDKTYFDDDKFGRREHYNGPSSDFKEKDTYKPDVKLEYIDDDGRLLNPKEAFRYLSHKFHGKGPGKNKVEKRHKKREQEMLMKQMSSTDTPLGTLTLLQHKQKETQSPFIVLSGNKSLHTAISKPKV